MVSCPRMPILLNAAKKRRLVFIGPVINAIGKMGNKSVSRAIAIENNVPVIPGTEKPIFQMRIYYPSARTLAFL